MFIFSKMFPLFLKRFQKKRNIHIISGLPENFPNDSHTFKKPRPTQKITPNNIKLQCFQNCLAPEKKLVYIIYMRVCVLYVYIYMYVCICMYVCMFLLQLLLLVVFFGVTLHWLVLYHLSILIFGSQGSKATCSNLHLALDHLITSNSFTYPKLSQSFKKP